MEAPVQPLTYGRYLRVPELLSLQARLSEAHDELQFIVVHQVFELWFKLALFELEAARQSLDHDQLREAARLLHRSTAVLRTATSAFDVLETMRPWDFLEFRSRLKPASGFQSRQFRELEFLSGLKDPRYLRNFESDPEDWTALQRRLHEPSLWDAFVGVLRRQGLPADEEPRLLEALIRVLRDSGSELNRLCEVLVEYDETLALWRYRHLLMVERVIGARPGTGAEDVHRAFQDSRDYFTGVGYLRDTLSKRCFPLLWEARTFVERE
ncbi:MAG: tryptophan 2,3-dioxygenase family protein [Armatimonadota bacterium]|nr:tryptophan 2,3-dioxygenase family protein [Armatimonadota bacterium]MDR5676234.1 tryptophan 2,3-dioxygenase family protein [Armatimonadota bacterium]MDR7387989.1 tryptophan 2,3-dioxygenase family protein [Armatimonadota bacterium]MDR7390283.1 tryptophan 2,3-dioxygenase family protein [Armatimonadota bacterium]MDR7394923.1 tryptophan 2,3-dioxygenase family protein [Armatimonadota bacterium]